MQRTNGTLISICLFFVNTDESSICPSVWVILTVFLLHNTFKVKTNCIKHTFVSTNVLHKRWHWHWMVLFQCRTYCMHKIIIIIQLHRIIITTATQLNPFVCRNNAQLAVCPYLVADRMIRNIRISYFDLHSFCVYKSIGIT